MVVSCPLPAGSELPNCGGLRIALRASWMFPTRQSQEASRFLQMVILSSRSEMRAFRESGTWAMECQCDRCRINTDCSGRLTSHLMERRWRLAATMVRLNCGIYHG